MLRLPQGNPLRSQGRFKIRREVVFKGNVQVVGRFFPNTEDGSWSEVVFFQILQVACRF